MELRAYVSYARTGDALAFWRSAHGHEVDYLVGGRVAPVAIEVKATRKASLRDARGLLALAEEVSARELHWMRRSFRSIHERSDWPNFHCAWKRRLRDGGC